MDIVVRDLSKTFNENRVLNNINYTFREGCITCIMGPSGSGKTTLFNILMGLMKPEAGEITGLEGKKISAVFQEDRLCESFTAIQNITAITGKKYTVPEIEAEFKKVELTEYEDKPVRELSGGMKRRVAILRAVMAESDIIFMDEPFKGLDEALKLKVIDYVRNKVKGKTVIIITHDMTEAEMLSDKIYNLV